MVVEKEAVGYAKKSEAQEFAKYLHDTGWSYHIRRATVYEEKLGDGAKWFVVVGKKLKSVYRDSTGVYHQRRKK